MISPFSAFPPIISNESIIKKATRRRRGFWFKLETPPNRRRRFGSSVVNTVCRYCTFSCRQCFGGVIWRRLCRGCCHGSFADLPCLEIGRASCRERVCQYV